MTSSAHQAAGHDVVWIDELSLLTCWSCLESSKLGRVAFVRAGRPVVLPVNHVVDRQTIVFRTDPHSALGTLTVRQPVAFEVDGAAPDHQTGWSVLVDGEIERVDGRARRRIGDDGPEPWAPGDRDEWLRIVPTAVTGRAISRRQQLPDGTFLPFMRPD